MKETQSQDMSKEQLKLVQKMLHLSLYPVNVCCITVMGNIILYNIDSHNLHQIQTENRQKVSLKKSFNEIPLIETAPHTHKKKIYKYQHCSLFQIPYNASQNETGSDVCQACMQ